MDPDPETAGAQAPIESVDGAQGEFDLTLPYIIEGQPTVSQTSPQPSTATQHIIASSFT